MVPGRPGEVAGAVGLPLSGGCRPRTRLASRALALDAALAADDGATLPLSPTETALLRDWLHQLAR